MAHPLSHGHGHFPSLKLEVSLKNAQDGKRASPGHILAQIVR